MKALLALCLVLVAIAIAGYCGYSAGHKEGDRVGANAEYEACKQCRAALKVYHDKDAERKRWAKEEEERQDAEDTSTTPTYSISEQWDRQYELNQKELHGVPK